MIYYCPKCHAVCPSSNHICKDEDIITYIKILEESANNSENRRKKISDAVFSMIEAYPEEILNKSEKIEVDSDYFRKLWNACELRFYDDLDVDSHINTWLGYQFTVSMCARLFKSHYFGQSTSEKLENILKHLKSVWEHKGWEDKFDVSVERLIHRIKENK